MAIDFSSRFVASMLGLTVLAFGSFSGAASSAALTPDSLRCEYRVDPLGVDVTCPRLFWKLQSDERGQRQTAYRVLVASTPEKLAADEGDLWDSGRVESDETIHIEYQGKPLRSRMRCYWKVRVWDKDQQPSAWSQPVFWTMGLLDPSDWQAKWITDPNAAKRTDAQKPAVTVRKQFEVESPVRRATIYATALGLYELRLNGQRVGDHILAPEWTDYRQKIQVQTYDVTDLVRQGANAMGAFVGDGWYSGRIGLAPAPGRNLYGTHPKVLVQLEIERTDGSRQVVATDESWRSTEDGPIRYSDILDGEIYDARRELLGWDQPGFDDAKWNAVEVTDRDDRRLVWQPNEPIRVVKQLQPIGLTEPKPGVFVFDLGQNMVGWIRATFRGPSGTEVVMQYAERLNPDGTVYTANLRRAPQRDTCLLAGEETLFEPHFTYHGFRYVQITGLSQKPNVDDLTGCVFHSAAPDVGGFVCSNPMIDQLMKNIVWVQRANLHSSPTDCPQRDERLGWMGDIQAFSQTAIFNMDMAAFFTKWLPDVREAQYDDGRFPDFAPQPFKPQSDRFFGVPAWGDAGVVVPWRMWQNYADRRAVEQQFAAVTRWIEYVRSNNPNLLWLKGRNNDYGDWLNGDTLKLDGYPHGSNQVPKEVFATMFFAHSTQLAAKMAGVLGRDEEAGKYYELFERIKAAFSEAFVDTEGRIKGNTQAGYALALHFDLLDESLRPKAVEHLLEAIRQYKDHPSTGIQSTHRMMLELSRRGQHDEACRLVNLRDVPSWGYMIEMGATTIWERWDGYVAGRGFQNPGMNSFNHWAFGSVGEWIWRDIAGINSDDAQPGYKHIIIHPRPNANFTWARGEYDSIRGRIVSDWRIDNGRFWLAVAVPPGSTATVVLEDVDTSRISEGDVGVDRAKGAKMIRAEDGDAVLAVESGEYHFSAPRLGK